MIADIYIQFELIPHYDKNYVAITMTEHTKRIGDKWTMTRRVGQRDIKISGWFTSPDTLGHRLSTAQRQMFQHYKKNLKYYHAIDEYCKFAGLPKLTILDKQTAEFINGFR